MASAPAIGWIGTGVMGNSMCKHLILAGHRATIFNRSPTKMEELISKGAVAAASPKEVAEKSDVIFTIVGYPADVREVYFGANGIFAGVRPGSVIVDCTTSEPKLAQEIAEEAARHSVTALDAPVSGGDVGAREARLSFMVGGERAAFDRVMPLLQCMGKSFNYMGPAGAGQHTKMCNQIVIATNMIGVVEGMIYGYKAGLDLEAVLKAISPGAAGSWSLSNYGPRMLVRNFDPGFFVEHFVKDMGIALTECHRMGIKLPGLELAHQLYSHLKDDGCGRLGTHSLLLAFEKMNAVTLPKLTPPAK